MYLVLNSQFVIYFLEGVVVEDSNPTSGKKETLKFEGEYDSDKANEECFPQNPLKNKPQEHTKYKRLYR